MSTEARLLVSSSPHIRDRASTRTLMLDVIIALLPSLIASTLLFGIRSLTLTLVTVAVAVLAESIARRVMKREDTIGDLSAVVTGMLLAFNLPPTLPYWMAAIGAVVAVVVVKQLFGGLGENFVNPALVGRVVLMISFPVAMTRWTVLSGADVVSTATPLAQLKAAVASGSAVPGTGSLPGYLDLLLGTHAGSLGEVSVLALLVGAAYLLARRVIAPWAPLAFIGTVGLVSWIAGQPPLYHMLSGGLILGAFFMATDYTTSPLTWKGKLVFGFGCGLLTAVIRLFGGMDEGVSYSILLLNILTPHIDKWTRPVPLGGGARHVRRA
jgi:electron transport complex protein RnfD